MPACFVSGWRQVRFPFPGEWDGSGQTGDVAPHVTPVSCWSSAASLQLADLESIS